MKRTFAVLILAGVRTVAACLVLVISIGASDGSRELPLPFVPTTSITNGATPGDFDGDGKADVAVYRPSTGQWIVLFPNKSPHYLVYHWGISSDVPTPGDYDGDGKTDIAVYRPSTGEWIVLFPNKSPQYLVYQWGISNDVPTPGDYDGDGKTDIAVYRPASGLWFVLLSTTNYFSYIARQWGVATDIPVPADYDGDGKVDMAVYRPTTGVWWLLSSFNPSSYAAYQWGLSTDIPVTQLVSAPRNLTPPPAPSLTWLWVMVIEETGACIVPATIEVVGGQSLGQTRIQADPCSAWDYGGGIMFEDLRPGEEMILRASAPGYSPQEVTVIPHIGGQQAFLISLSRPREP